MTTPSADRFDYMEADPSLGSASALPYAPITLQFGDREIRVSALVDSGATLNVLPMEFDIRFCRSQLFFEIRPREKVEA